MREELKFGLFALVMFSAFLFVVWLLPKEDRDLMPANEFAGHYSTSVVPDPVSYAPCDTAFRFGDCVSIKSGFYRDRPAIVLGFKPGDGYTVRFTQPVLLQTAISTSGREARFAPEMSGVPEYQLKLIEEAVK